MPERNGLDGIDRRGVRGFCERGYDRVVRGERAGEISVNHTLFNV